MTTITQVISGITDPPDPTTDTGDTYSDKASLTMTELKTMGDQINTWRTQANTVAGEVNTNATTASNASTAAVAAANFQGNWSSLSGAKTAGISAKHDGDVWLLTENTADVTADEPGVSAKWHLMRDAGKWTFSTSGTGSAGDAVAIVDDDTIAAVSNTARTLNVASTTALTTSSAKDGTCTIYVPQERVVVSFYIGASNYVYCKVGAVDASTESITWGSEQTVSAVDTDSVQGCLIDTNRIFILAVRANNPAAVVTVTGSTKTVTVGSFANTIDLDTAFSVDNYISQVVRIADNKVAFAGRDNADTYPKCCACSISGTTVTPGAEFQLNAAAAGFFGIASLNDDEFHVLFDNSTTGILVAQVTVNGTTCSLSAGPTNTDLLGGTGTALTSPIACVSDRNQGRAYLVFRRNDAYAASVTFEGAALRLLGQVVIDTDANLTHQAAYMPGPKPGAGILGIVSSDAGNSHYPTFYQVNVSQNGGVALGGSATQVEAKASNFTAAYEAAYDVVQKRFVFAYPQSTDDDADAVLVRPAFDDTTAPKFIGFADFDFTDASNVVCSIIGGVNASQSGLEPGQMYYIDKNGNVTPDYQQAYAIAGMSIAATKIMV